MKKVVCPCCNGEGKIDLEVDTPVYLAPNCAAIYRAIKARPNALDGRKLVDIVYGHRADGGPVTAYNVIHALIWRMNKLNLPAVGEQIKADRRGPGATYRIVKV